MKHKFKGVNIIYTCENCGLKAIKYSSGKSLFVMFTDLIRLGFVPDPFIKADSISCEQVIMKEALE